MSITKGGLRVSEQARIIRTVEFLLFDVLFILKHQQENDHDQAPMYQIAYTVSIQCQSQIERLETVSLNSLIKISYLCYILSNDIPIWQVSSWLISNDTTILSGRNCCINQSTAPNSSAILSNTHTFTW